MQNRLYAVLVLATVAGMAPTAVSAQSGPAPRRAVHESLAADQSFVRGAFDSDRARDIVAFMDQYFRLPGNTGFNASIQRVIRELEAAGYRNETENTGGPLTYRLERRAMERPTWEPVSASLQIVGMDGPLLRFRTNHNLMAINSFSTPPEGVEAEVIDVGAATPGDFDGKDVRGKIVFGETRVGRLFTEAVVNRGALGVIGYSIPAFNRPAQNRDLISYSSIPLNADAESWGLQLTTNARDRLREALQNGPVRVRVQIATRVFKSEELTLVADVRGATHPDERFVFSAHVQEAGANDNATGVATLSEVARVLAQGVRTGSFEPGRTISMIWGDEISSTRRYLQEDPDRTAGVLWGLSLDMVGENTDRTGGTFLIEKMPDPSAVWTRGTDKHSEWGGSPMKVDELTPHYFNDFILNRCLDQGADNGWVVRTNPFEGGSDHVPFLRAGLPGLLLWHFTDQFYHTDADHIENVSAETLKNVGVCAAVSAMTLTSADAEVAQALIGELEQAALARIEVERVLSAGAVADGVDAAGATEQRLIIQTWGSWYDDALATMVEVEVGGSSPETTARLAGARAAIAEATRTALASLDDRKLTIDRLYSLPNLIGTAPRGFAWSRDGRQLAFLWNDEGRNFRDVWVLDTEDPEGTPWRVTQMPQAEIPNLDPRDAVAAAEAEIRVDRDRGVGAVSWHPDGTRMLFGFRGDFWLVTPGEAPTRLTETRAGESQPAFSPAGDVLAFLRGGDLWLMPAEGPASASVRKTLLAGSDVRLASFQWSGDGSKIALLEMDQGDVQVRGIPDYLGEETRMVDVRRAYPGEASTRQRIGVVDASLPAGGAGDARSVDTGSEIRWIEMGEPSDGGSPDMLLSYRWSPDGAHLAIDTSDFFAKNRRIFVADFRVGDDREDEAVTTRLLVREADPLNETFYHWRMEWSRDSSLLYFLSDRAEDYHVWAVAPADVSPEPVQLTSGAWAVASIHPVESGLLVVGNRGNAEERHLFRISESGDEPVQLSRRAGTHTPVVSPDGQHAAVAFSSDDTPPDLLLTTLGPQRSERVVTHSPLDEFSNYNWVVPQYVTFRSHVDGTLLHGRLTLPPDWTPERSYPAILGSVYTDAVRNQWGGRTAHPTWGLDQYFAQEGYVILNIDMRGSWGRGREHRRGIRLDYGGIDIDDLESGVHFLETLGYVDMDRVGLWGSSYGGLMTVMSLFRKPGLYAAGVAGAPATSVWHALTGQMAVMLAPEDSPDEYIDSSAFMHADGLEDPLMIIHGMRDRVVLYKDTVTLVQRLLLLGKDVDLVTLPNSGHGWDNESLPQTRFAFKKMIDFFNRHLGGAR